MMAHFDVENNLFVPTVRTLENNLRSILSKETVEAGDIAESENTQLSALSKRERDIIRTIAQGKANKEIADELFISVHTVATHRRNICSKLGIHSSAGLTIFAIINHLVDINDVKPL